MIRVFSRVRFTLLALGVSAAVYACITWMPFVGLSWTFLIDTPTILGGVEASARLLIAAFGDTDTTDALYTMFVSLLFGINVTLLVFYYKMYRFKASGTPIATGMFGSLSVVLGFGCAACGTLFLQSFFATLGSTGALSFFGLQSNQFRIVGILLLCASIVLLVRNINKPAVCPI